MTSFFSHSHIYVFTKVSPHRSAGLEALQNCNTKFVGLNYPKVLSIDFAMSVNDIRRETTQEHFEVKHGESEHSKTFIFGNEVDFFTL